MSGGVSAAEAATLWGCSQRHIQYLASRGELPVVGYREGRMTLLNNGCAMLSRVALYDPAAVLRLRAAKKASKSAHARRLNMRRRGVASAEARLRGVRLGQAWRAMPEAERQKWGRDWRRGAHLWMQRSA